LKIASDLDLSFAHLDSQSIQPDLSSKEDQNTVGKVPVSEAAITAAREQVSAWLSPGNPGHSIFLSGEPRLRMCLLDGFLLFNPISMPGIMESLDIKLFLLVSRAKATERREARDGYVTLEGFWTDPPGYVDKIVWPNYAKEHAWMFQGGDVEGELKAEVLAERHIRAQTGKGLDIDMETTLRWAVKTIMSDLEALFTAK
jgi:nicotinamide/nicotinate riboside kinase